LVAATYNATTGTITPTNPVGTGTHTFGYGYVDSEGNASASGPTMGITIDTTAPTAPTSAPMHKPYLTKFMPNLSKLCVKVAGSV
jgi:hypothetical protein